MPASRNYSSTAGLMHLVGGITGAAASLIVDTVTGLPTAPFTLLLDPGLATEEVVEVTAAGGTTLTVTRGVDGTSAQAHTNGAEVRHAYSARDFQDSRNHEAATAAHGVTGAVVGTTNVQALQNKTLDATNTIVPLTTHAALTAAHGTAGVVVGTTDTQTLTNKGIDGATNTLTNVPLSALPALPKQVADQAARDAYATSVGLSDGLQVYRLDLHRIEIYNGTSWASASPVGAIFTGTTTTTGFLSIPHGLGYTPTRVTLAPYAYDANVILEGLTISSIDATNIVLHVSRLDTNLWLANAWSMSVAWTAQ